ncbi:MAG: M55 family metallopeptidase [Chloroflexi bacterium]|nr:M55 family metallopeptidase [Chloroflexota bacterium]
MRIYILTDIEGACGVSRWDQGDCTSPTYPQAVRLMTAELTACVEGIRSIVPNAEICIWDAHGAGSIDFEQVPAGCQLINSGALPAPLLFDQGWDALFFLCQHSKAGTPNGNLCHTYSSSLIEYFKINGLELGEFGCRAALAGSYGIPTVFVSGDDTMMAEAQALVPGILCAQVKVGLGTQLARHLAPADARALIRETAALAILHYKSIPPLILAGPPFEQEIRVGPKADPAIMISRGFQQLDAFRYVKRSNKLDDLWI